MKSVIHDEGYLTIDAEGHWAHVVVDLDVIELGCRAAVSLCSHHSVVGTGRGGVRCQLCGVLFSDRRAWFAAMELVDQMQADAVRVHGVNDKEATA